jgi:hypothetical protein
MRANFTFLAALLALVNVPMAWAQNPGSYGSPRPDVVEAQGGPVTVEGATASTGLSNWITYSDRGPCCHSTFGSTPIGTEFFLRVGPSIPFGNEQFGRTLDTGWMIEGGARALFFNADYNRAWTVEGGLSSTYHHAGDQALANPININGNILTLREYHRTLVHLGLGREYYLFGTTAVDPGRKVRVGFDGGGRYGSASAEFPQIRHTTDVVGGMYGAVHGDVEFPFCRCVFLLGLRGQYAYTWSDILDGPSDLQEINLLVNIGLRY